MRSPRRKSFQHVEVIDPNSAEDYFKFGVAYLCAIGKRPTQTAIRTWLGQKNTHLNQQEIEWRKAVTT